MRATKMASASIVGALSCHRSECPRTLDQSLASVPLQQLDIHQIPANAYCRGAGT